MLTINNEEIKELIKAFHNLTGIKVVIYDNNFNEIIAYPKKHSLFCGIVRQSENYCGECDKSAEIMCRKCADEKRVIIENCHAGLTEAVAPLTDGISVIGYIMFGQITNIFDKEKLFSFVSKKCEKYNLNLKELKKATDETLYYSDNQIDDASKMLDALAGYIVLKKLAAFSDNTLGRNIAEYIKKNLSENLSVQALCEKYYLSKTEIYKITKAYMPEGIAAFVKRERIEKAGELLRQSNMTNVQIAEAIGFSDVNYFMRIFKKQKGISAGNYRKKYKKC